jgi:virginiamycin B lyase
MKMRIASVLVLVAGFLVIGTAEAPAVPNIVDHSTRIEQWQVPVIQTASPAYLIKGPDNEMWATTPGNDYVFRFDHRDGAVISTFHLSGNNHSNNTHLAAGPDGNVWVTMDRPDSANPNGTTANAIVRITPQGQQTNFPLSANGGPVVSPQRIVAGPPSDPNSMWFGESASGFVMGRISTVDGSVSNFALPGLSSGAFALASSRGPDAAGTPNAAVWLSTYGETTDHVVRLSVSPTGPPQITLSVDLPAGWHPFDMTGGPTDPVTGKQDGVWVSDDITNRIGRVSYDGTLTSWTLDQTDPNPPNNDTGVGPVGISLGPDNAIWVAARTINSIIKLDPTSGQFTQYRLPGGIIRPYEVAAGSDGNVWWDSVDTARIGRIDINPLTPPAPTASAFTTSGTFSYYSYANTQPGMLQNGFPVGISAAGDSLEVTMQDADRIQRVPTTLANGPPAPQDEQGESNPAFVTTAQQSALPWRTMQTGGGSMPHLVIGDVGPLKQEWATDNNDTAFELVPGQGGVTGNVTSNSFTLTGLAACCLTVANVIYLSGPQGIAADSAGNVYMTEFTSGHIAVLTPGLTVDEQAAPSSDSDGTGPADLTVTADGNLWFTQMKSDQIGVFNPVTNAFTNYPLPPGAQPYGITTGRDGAVWFTLRALNEIGRIDATGTVKTWTLPTADSQPTAIKVGPDGALYITEYLTGKVARLSVNGAGAATWTEWGLPYGDLSRPFWLTIGPDHKIWVTLPYQDRVASLDVSSTPAPPVVLVPTSGATTRQHLVVAGTTAPGDTVTVSTASGTVGTTTADPRGRWLVPATLPPGSYVLTAVATSTNQVSRYSAPVPITVN